jgi:hypothetical protein
MLLYYGSITMLPEPNACLCEVGHIGVSFRPRSEQAARSDDDAVPSGATYAATRTGDVALDPNETAV